MDSPSRLAPGSACQACRRLKMRCVKETDSPCSRCLKSGRECVLPPASNGRPQHKRRRSILGASTANQSPAQQSTFSPPTPRAEGLTQLLSAAHTVREHERTVPLVLHSIYSKSPYSTFEDQYQETSHLYQQRGAAATHEPSIQLMAGEVPNPTVTTNDTAQLIEIFRERLTVSLPLLKPTDFNDTRDLIANHSVLVTCISYVTARYVPGYEGYRKGLIPEVLDILQSVLSQKISSIEEELSILKGLIILYIFAHDWNSSGNAAPGFSDRITYWNIKATCEAFAVRIKVHQAVAHVVQEVKAGKVIDRPNPALNKYLFWLWFYTVAQHVSIVTGTPPTIQIDASIRIAPTLLKGLKFHSEILLLLGEVELCLLWEKLGQKDLSIREWWCSANLEDILDKSSQPTTRLTLDDIDTALSEWRTQSRADHLQYANHETIMNLSPDHHFHYTRFCLHTHFIRHLEFANMQEDQIQAVTRSVDAALNVLRMSHGLGPKERDQLRYFSPFFYVNLAYAACFALQAVRAFPTIFHSPEADIETVKSIASLLLDLGLDRKHKASVAGRLLLRDVQATIETVNERQNRSDQIAVLPTLTETSVDDEQSSTFGQDLDQTFDNNIFDFPDFFGAHSLGTDFDIPSLRTWID